MTLKKRVHNVHVIRCFNMITDERSARFGLTCNKRLIDKNSEGQVAGEIKCPRCGAVYEIKNNVIYLLERR